MNTMADGPDDERAHMVDAVFCASSVPGGHISDWILHYADECVIGAMTMRSDSSNPFNRYDRNNAYT